MNILITGSCGFLGYNISKMYLTQGHTVHGIDSLNRKGSEINLKLLQSSGGKFDFQKLEIHKCRDVLDSLKPDLIIHLAAQVAVTTSLKDPYSDFQINSYGTFIISEYAGRNKLPLIYTSTNKVYGDAVNNVELVEGITRYEFAGEMRELGIPENFSVDSKHHTPYGVSKLCGDLYVREYGGIVNRCSCMYGPNQFGIVDQGWLSYIAKNNCLKMETTIFGDGKQSRDILHIDDVMRLIFKQGELLLSSKGNTIKGEVYNVGGGYKNIISLIELCKEWGIKPKYSEWRPSDQKAFYCNIEKAKNTFNWSPIINNERGLKELYEWTAKSLANSTGN